MPLEVLESVIEGKNRHEQVKVPVLGIEKRNNDKAEPGGERYQTRSPFRDPRQIHKELVGQPLVSAPSRSNNNPTLTAVYSNSAESHFEVPASFPH